MNERIDIMPNLMHGEFSNDHSAKHISDDGVVTDFNFRWNINEIFKALHGKTEFNQIRILRDNNKLTNGIILAESSKSLYGLVFLKYGGKYYLRSQIDYAKLVFCKFVACAGVIIDVKYRSIRLINETDISCDNLDLFYEDKKINFSEVRSIYLRNLATSNNLKLNLNNSRFILRHLIKSAEVNMNIPDSNEKVKSLNHFMNSVLCTLANQVTIENNFKRNNREYFTYVSIHYDFSSDSDYSELLSRDHVFLYNHTIIGFNIVTILDIGKVFITYSDSL